MIFSLPTFSSLDQPVALTAPSHPEPQEWLPLAVMHGGRAEGAVTQLGLPLLQTLCLDQVLVLCKAMKGA